MTDNRTPRVERPDGTLEKETAPTATPSQEQNTGGPTGFSGISIGLLWTVLILMVVAIGLIVFFAM